MTMTFVQEFAAGAHPGVPELAVRGGRRGEEPGRERAAPARLRQLLRQDRGERELGGHLPQDYELAGGRGA